LPHLEVPVSLSVLQAGDVEGIQGHYAQLRDTCESTTSGLRILGLCNGTPAVDILVCDVMCGGHTRAHTFEQSGSQVFQGVPDAHRDVRIASVAQLEEFAGCNSKITSCITTLLMDTVITSVL
jgi:hypothetical protein